MEPRRLQAPTELGGPPWGLFDGQTCSWAKSMMHGRRFRGGIARILTIPVGRKQSGPILKSAGWSHRWILRFARSKSCARDTLGNQDQGFLCSTSDRISQDECD